MSNVKVTNHGSSSRYTTLKYLNLSAKLSTFSEEIISYWQELNNFVSRTNKDVANQIVWNNRWIKVDKTSLSFRSWHQAGIYKMSSLGQRDSEN